MMGIHWSGEITFGNVLMMMTFVGAAVAFYYNTNWRLRILESWRQEQSTIGEVALRTTRELIDSVIELKQIAKGQDRRLVMLEDARYSRKESQQPK
jgi:hypothetical protein